MTSTQAKEMHELNISDEAELAARTERAEAMARGEGRMTQAKIQEIVAADPSKALFSRAENWDDLAETVPMTPAPKPTRKPPVKGVCVNCGKNWSRHIIEDPEARIAYCGSGPESTLFSLERPNKAEATPGALTRTNVEQINHLMGLYWAAYMNQADATAQLKQRGEDLQRYLDSLTAK